MARDEGLEDLIRAELPRGLDIAEKAMFGGRAWLVNGYLALGARADGMLIRLGKGGDGWALALPHVGPMMQRERRMEGWVRASADAWGDDALRRRLIDAALAYARALPPKA